MKSLRAWWDRCRRASAGVEMKTGPTRGGAFVVSLVTASPLDFSMRAPFSYPLKLILPYALFVLASARGTANVMLEFTFTILLPEVSLIARGTGHPKILKLDLAVLGTI